MGYTKIEFQPKDKLPASTLNAMQDAIIENERKSVKIATGSYDGTGGYGSTNPNTITVPFKPLICMLWANNAGDSSRQTIMCYPMAEYYMVNNDNGAVLTWGNNTISWYTKNTGTTAAGSQYNASGTTYSYLIIGY